jgi:hypothetical protein
MDCKLPFSHPLGQASRPDQQWWLATGFMGVPNHFLTSLFGTYFVYYIPALSAPTTYVYSFYAKAEKNGQKVAVWVQDWGGPKSMKAFELTTDWKRYWLSGILKSNTNACGLPGKAILMIPHPETKIWIDGTRMEKGETPTEFDENELPKKTK